MQIRKVLEEKILEAFEHIAVDVDRVQVLPASKPEFGDYQYNGAMALAKRLKRNPKEIAQSLVESIQKGDMIESLEVAGPGFINIKLSKYWLSTRVTQALEDTRLGVSIKNDPIKVVVDYSSPNMAKQMHVGHLRSTIIGDTLANLLQFMGESVIRQNHIGDWGTQFGMLIAYLEELGEGSEGTLKDLEQFYKDAKKRFDEDESFANRAREYVVKLQSGDVYCLNLWKNFIDKSLSHCEEIYQMLGVNLTREDVRAESDYNDELANIVKELQEKGLLVESRGAKCVFVEDSDTPLIVQKSDGGYLYATTDLAAIKFRVQKLGAKRILYVVDSRQSEHFKLVFKVARAAGYAPEDIKLEHVKFGMMLDKSGRPFKTRDGGTVKLIDLLQEAVNRAKEAIRQKDEYSKEEVSKIAEIVGIGAVKYADLSINRESDYVFDWDKMLSLDGNTSLYQQYAYARIQSIIRRYGKEPTGTVAIEDELERKLVLKLLELEDTLILASNESAPHYLTGYLYSLTTLFMKFYENNPILKEDIPKELKESRLMIAKATAETIKLVLGLMGIKTVDRL